MEEPGGLPSMGSHRVGHDQSDLAVTGYIGVLQQRAGSQVVRNIKQLMLTKETRFVKLRNLVLFLYGQMQENGLTDINCLICTSAIWISFLCFHILSFLRVHCREWLQSDSC